jgi:hypothetical protein
MDDFWSYHSSDLSESFVFFLQLAEGSRIGLWLYPALADPDQAPVVLVGSEGELRFLGRDTTQFLARVASGVGIGELYDFPNLEDLEPFRSDLAVWLQGRARLDQSGVAEVASADPRNDHPDLAAWVQEHADRVLRECQADPNLRHMHAQLRNLLPRDRLERLEPWRSYEFVADCLADHFEVWHMGRQTAVPEDLTLAIEPAVRAYRAQRAEALPERGGWYEAHFRLTADGYEPPACFFELPPQFGPGSSRRTPLQSTPNLNVTVGDYRADLALFPRTERWMPTWLNEVLQKA